MRRQQKSMSTTVYILFVLGISTILATFIILFSNDVFALTKGDKTVYVTIEENSGNGQIAKALKDAGLIKYKGLFSMFMSLAHVKRGDINPGKYTLNTSLDYRAMINIMKNPKKYRQTVRITIPEGYTVEQIVNLLFENGVCEKDALWDAVANYDFDYDFLEGIEHNEHRLEGYLYPDTYEFYLGDTPENALARFLDNFESKITDDIKSKVKDSGYSLHQIITVASLIEREAKLADEQPIIAGVIYNRLKSRSLPYLQIDASVQYALGHKEKLSYADLETDSPYNTYKYKGLPVGPISNPGMNAILAALNPTKHSYYYYVADSDGSHIFSKTLAEHETAKAKVKQKELLKSSADTDN